MTNDEMLAMFKDQVKNHSISIFPDSLTRHWFDEGQIDIARRTACVTTDSNITSVASQREYSMPTDVLRLLHINWYDGTTYSRLEGTTLDALEVYEDYPNETAGTPTHYYIKQGSTPTIGFYPKPSASQANAVTIHYLKRPTNLTTSSTNPNIPEPYHRLIVQYALYRCLQKDAKTDTADRYYSQYLREVEMMRGDLNSWDRKRRLRLVPYDRDHRQRSLAHHDD